MIDDSDRPIRTVPTLATFLELEPVLGKICAANSLAELETAFSAFADLHGLSRMGQIRSHRLPGGIWQAQAIGWQVEAFNAEYLGNRIYEIDPFVSRCQREVLPIAWGLSEHRRNLDADGRRFYEFHSAMRSHHGLGVPIHGPDSVSLLGTTDDGSEKDFRKRLPELAASAQLFALYVAEALHRIGSLTPQPVPSRPRLTPRERECLTWVAAGKTAWEISQILHLAETTVVYYCENAKKKLESKTMPQAVAKAMAFGLISL